MAQIELSDEELLLRYGALIWCAVSAFGEDPSYLGDMAAQARMISYKRDLWSARSEAQKRGVSGDELRSVTQDILQERGVRTPRRARAA
jgi:hypothetical protein